jgi:hypothetical protein
LIKILFKNLINTHSAKPNRAMSARLAMRENNAPNAKARAIIGNTLPVGQMTPAPSAPVLVLYRPLETPPNPLQLFTKYRFFGRSSPAPVSRFSIYAKPVFLFGVAKPPQDSFPIFQ